MQTGLPIDFNLYISSIETQSLKPCIGMIHNNDINYNGNNVETIIYSQLSILHVILASTNSHPHFLDGAVKIMKIMTPKVIVVDCPAMEQCSNVSKRCEWNHKMQ